MIYLVRHGDVHNPDDIYYGRIPGFRLSERGNRQAQAAGDYLRNKPLTAIYSSPQQRAQETAAHIASHHPTLQVEIDDAFNEVYTPFDGTARAELMQIEFDMYTGTQPPYEQPADILERAQAGLNALRRQYERQHIVAVSHGDVIAFTLLWTLHKPLDLAEKQLLGQYGITDGYPATASITTLTYHTDDPDEIPAMTHIKPYDGEG